MTFQVYMLRIENGFHRIMLWSLFCLGSLMTTVVFLGVLFRYVLKAPLPWAEELSRYLMVWGASLGASIAYREGSHVAVTVFLERLPGVAGKILTWAGHIVVTIFILVVMVQGLLLISKLAGQTSPAMGIPMAVPYLAIPVGSLCILFESLVMFLTGFKIKKV